MFRLLYCAPAGRELTVIIPPGGYWVGDPCYVMGDEAYAEKGDIVFPPGDNKGRNVMLATADNAHILNWSTIVGDGTYPLYLDQTGTIDFGDEPSNGPRRHVRMDLAVDSGQLAILDARLVAKQDGLKDGATITLTRPLTVTIRENGDLAGYGIYVAVEQEDDEEDDHDYEDR